MAKAVLISIRPEWVEEIANGRKTIEVRKTKPNLKTPFKCYIYCTNTRPFLVWGDVFRGDWFTEFTHLSGYSRAEADEIWNVFNGHVAGEFVCDNIRPLMAESFTVKEDAEKALLGTSLTSEQIKDYAGWKGKKWWDCKDLYKWHISKLEIYDTPKELTEFNTWKKCKTCSKSGYESTACIYDENCMVPVAITKAPQSWCYVEKLK